MNSVLGTYDSIKYVKNTCPKCGRCEEYRLKFIYSDEGSMVCLACNQADAKEYLEKQKNTSALDAAHRLADYCLANGGDEESVMEDLELILKQLTGF